MPALWRAAFGLGLLVAVAAALVADVVAEHRPEYEVFLGRQLVERAVYEVLYGLYALALAEEEVYAVLAGGLYEERDALAGEPLYGERLVLAVHRVEHHLPYALLQFVDMIEEHFQFHGVYRRRFHNLLVCIASAGICRPSMVFVSFIKR